MSYKCKECGQEFKSERSLHAHLKKHSLTLGEYYTKHFPRYNLLTKEALPFKNKADYFAKDFATSQQMLKWCNQASKEEVKAYILKELKHRVKTKELKYAPNHLEVLLNKLPPLELFREHYGSYSAACEEVGVEPLYNKGVIKKFYAPVEEFENIGIFIDTREQQPLKFNNSQEMKLDFGDYTSIGDDYTHTYVDRKSETDFKSTLSTGFDRFRRELQRAKDFNSYLYIVVESSIPKIKKNNNFCPHRSNLRYIWHNMRVLSHDFARSCQFVFSGNRRNSEKIIPRLLAIGEPLWNVDIQYYLDKK